ncbi:MAG: deoxyribonuclease IV [Halarsenatibacteraceae bacterium]
MKLGKHVSIAGGIDKAISRAVNIGCNSVQIFVNNPRGWKNSALGDELINDFKIARKSKKIDPVVVHSIYLINLASPKKDLWEKSIQGLIDDYRRSDKIGAEYLVFHPGSHTGSGEKKGTLRIIEGLNKVLKETEGNTEILLENVAGAGTAIGKSISELNEIIKNIDEPERVGFCIDTCHAFSAGYDLASRDGLDDLIEEIEAGPGLEKLKVLHLNDSKFELGTNKDRHAHIGEGFIGKKGFTEIINHPKLINKTFILETPWFDDLDYDPDVDILKELRK